MSRNGSGVYSPSATGYPAVASTTIESAKYNAVIADIATALTLSSAANGETTITANIPLAGYKITGLGNASADTDALNRVTADARYALLTGATFTGSPTFSGTLPRLRLNETDAATDEKNWDITSDGGNFYIQAVNDALSSGSSPLVMVRTGTTVDSITFTGTTIAVTGNATVSGSLTVGGNAALTTATGVLASTVTSGSFTAALRATNGGANLDTGTAYWHKHGRAVTLYLPELLTTDTTTTLVIDDIPAEIQFAVNGSAATYQVMAGKDNGAHLAVTVSCLYGTDYWTLKVTAGYAAFNAAAAEKGILSGSISYMMDDA